MKTNRIAPILTLACLFIGCEYRTVSDNREDIDSLNFSPASSATTTNELDYLKWLYINHVSPELLPGDSSKNRSHFYIYVELDLHVEQDLARHTDILEATRNDIKLHTIRGYAIIDSDTKIYLRYLHSGSIWKASLGSEISKREYDPKVWAGDIHFDSFNSIVQASADTDKLIESVLDKNERDGKGWGWTEYQSYLLVGGYIDNTRFVYVIPNPYTRIDPLYSDISKVEENAIEVMEHGDQHFVSWHSDIFLVE